MMIETASNDIRQWLRYIPTTSRRISFGLYVVSKLCPTFKYPTRIPVKIFQDNVYVLYTLQLYSLLLFCLAYRYPIGKYWWNRKAVTFLLVLCLLKSDVIIENISFSGCLEVTVWNVEWKLVSHCSFITWPFWFWVCSRNGCVIFLKYDWRSFLHFIVS